MRARVAALPPLWRSIGLANQLAWNRAAGKRQCGYVLFNQLNRNLMTLGEPVPIRRPPPKPVFAAWLAANFVPVYAINGSVTTLVSWQLYYTLSFASAHRIVVRASRPFSASRRSISRGYYRIASIIPAKVNGNWPLNSDWLALYGQPPAVGHIAVELVLMDPATGYAAGPLKLETSWAANNALLPTPGGITIEVDQVNQGTIPSQTIEVDGVQII